MSGTGRGVPDKEKALPGDPKSIDVDAMTAGEFVALVKSSSDAEIRASFEQAGTAKALDRIFSMMSDYYRPERAAGVEAAVQWKIKAGGEIHDYVIRLTSTACKAERGTVDRPTTTVSTDVARFARIVAGQANAVKLLMTRKLKASGDVMFARRIDGFFDMPGT